MPVWLNTILNIVLFIVCLSTLVMVHEAGHFTAAKIFGVYCDDFSIGFGKAIIHKKRKRGETYFSLRTIPFGGYVSMAGEEGELPSGKQVPVSRSINGIKKWKTAIILSSGVIMNVVLSLVLFYISNQFFPVTDVYIQTLTVEKNSIAENAGLLAYDAENKYGMNVSIGLDSRYKENGSQVWYYAYDNTADVIASADDATTYVTFVKDGVETKVPVLGLIKQANTNITNPSVDDIIEFYTHLNVPLDSKENYPDPFYANFEGKITASSKDNALGDVKSVTFNMKIFTKQEGMFFCDYCHKNIDASEIYHDEENGHYFHNICDSEHLYPLRVYKDYGLNNTVKPITLNVIQDEKGNKSFERSGISFYSTSQYLSYGEAVSQTFKDFGNGAVTIFRALGSLFVGQGWDNVGSIVAIYTQTSSVLNTMGISYFIYYWALISVNLAIFNLLPFPGLDGWQLLVLAIEGISKRKVPEKAKTIMSYVGLALLMGFMLFLIVKDVFMFF